MPPERLCFGDAPALAGALAGRIAGALAGTIATEGAASLAVSGGTTPHRFLTALGQQDIAWDRVGVTLVDERWVGEDDPRSNAGLVRATLLAGRARAAALVPLYTGASDPRAGLAEAERRIGALARPFAAVVLGMGEDGHTASWFPGADRLPAALDPAGARLVAAVEAPGAGEPRITLTLPAVLDTGVLVLHIEGEAKRAALDAALGPGPAGDMPVRAVLRQTRVPPEIYWCP